MMHAHVHQADHIILNLTREGRVLSACEFHTASSARISIGDRLNDCMRIAVLLFEGYETLDAHGPIQFLGDLPVRSCVMHTLQ